MPDATSTVPPLDDPSESKLSIALRDELAKLLEGNLTEGKARRLSKIAQTGAQLLKLVRPDMPDVDDLRRKDNGFIGAVGYDIPAPISEDSDDDGGGNGSSYAIASAPVAETFGARMFRELITVLPGIMSQQHQTPERMVDAITLARQNGMTDVAAELEKKLIGKPLDGERPVHASPKMALASAAVHDALEENATCRVCGTDCSRDSRCTPKGIHLEESA